jgi:catechol 2,3-dioxygenase-like lactoylglutathione lyase family enzyme
MTALLSLKTRLSTPLFVQSRDWYRDLFGLDVLEEWNDPGDRGCILGLSGTAGEAFLEIHQTDAPQGVSGLSLQFRVEDVDAFMAPDEDRFTYEGPVSRPWGSRYLFFCDPNGVAVVVFSGTSL